MRSVYQAALADLAGVPARSRWVANGAVRLHALDYGGDGVPLVVLPGITSPAITMDFVAGQIGDLVRPIILDVRGRGLSDSGGEYSLVEYAEDAEALIRGLELDVPLLLGHSLGARIAATAAVRARPRPVPDAAAGFSRPARTGPARHRRRRGGRVVAAVAAPGARTARPLAVQLRRAGDHADPPWL